MPDTEAGAVSIGFTSSKRGMPGYAAVAGLCVVTAVILRMLGQPWWCKGGEYFLWSGDVWSMHNSQHLVDPYSFTHVSHGLIFFFVILCVPRLRALPMAWRLFLVLIVEAAWEVVENTPMVINRYRETTMALGYEGDSITNSLGDMACFILGFAVAAKLGWRWALGLFVAMELALLVTIRDNLTLNVIMLLLPVEAIKTWQTAGGG